jgi:hypothetical protein
MSRSRCYSTRATHTITERANFVAAIGNFSVPSSDVASAIDNFGAPHSDISPRDIDFLGLRTPGLLSEHQFWLGELRHCFPEQQSCCSETSTLSFRATISKLRASSPKLATPRLPLAEGKCSLRREPPIRLHRLGTALRRGCCGAGAAAEALAQVVGDGLHPLHPRAGGAVHRLMVDEGSTVGFAAGGEHRIFETRQELARRRCKLASTSTAWRSRSISSGSK